MNDDGIGVWSFCKSYLRKKQRLSMLYLLPLINQLNCIAHYLQIHLQDINVC